MSDLNKFEKYIISNKDKIKISSKEVKRGDIFLALKGKNYHGNNLLLRLLKRGQNIVSLIIYIIKKTIKLYMLNLSLIFYQL